MGNKNDLNEIMRKKNGANFYWADLHIHTPFWHGFRLPSRVKKDDESWKREFAKKYIEKAIDRNEKGGKSYY